MKENRRKNFDRKEMAKVVDFAMPAEGKGRMPNYLGGKSWKRNSSRL
jgi:hypothetical protein